MNAFVVDTNVAVVANGRDTHASHDCQLACIEKLEEIRSSRVVVDQDGDILEEYSKRLRHRGQPGVGDAFFRHIFFNQYDLRQVSKVSIHSLENGSYREFPDDPGLNGFDVDDHKFVAVAVVSQDNPPIVNAVDSDWREYEERLSANGIVVEELCPREFE